MIFAGALHKMDTINSNPIKYSLHLGDDFIAVNQLIGKQLELKFAGKYICFCGDEVKKVYRANFCYECYFSKPQAGEAIFRPELSLAHLGKADRDLDFEKRYQLQPHVVYLANSGGLKVGVTRANQKQTRWMDQGATQAIVLAETTNRYEAGLIEVALKNHFSDKTNWRNMLQNSSVALDMNAEKQKAKSLIPADMQHFISDDDAVYEFVYPVNQYPPKIKSVNLANAKGILGTLSGIKGQYWLFEEQFVINIRSHEGYVVSLALK